MHIDAAVCVPGRSNGGVEALKPALLHRDGVGGFVVAGLGFGIPVEVVRAVDSGAALALEGQLLLAVGTLAEGDDTIAGVQDCLLQTKPLQHRWLCSDKTVHKV